MADENSDELLDPNDIEALLNQSSDNAGAPGAQLDVSDIESLLQGSAGGPEQTLDQASAHLAAAAAPEIGSIGQVPSELGTPTAFTLQEFGQNQGPQPGAIGLNALQDVEFDLHIELGRTKMRVEEVLTLQEGSVVPLDKLAGDPVDIIANGRLVARGEVLVLNDNFCVRVAEILSPNF